MDLQYCVEGRLHIILRRFQQVEYLSRVSPTFDSRNTLGLEELHELIRLDSSRHNDNLEWFYFGIVSFFALTRCISHITLFGLLHHFVFKQSHQNIGVDTSLMCLIQYKNIEHSASHEFPDGHTICHECDLSFSWSFFLKSYTVSDLLS